jgi:hypothetical protein
LSDPARRAGADLFPRSQFAQRAPVPGDQRIARILTRRSALTNTPVPPICSSGAVEVSPVVLMCTSST